MSINKLFFDSMPGAFWNPLLFLVLFLVIIVLLLVFCARLFRSDYNRESEQVKPFNSGNLDEINYNVKSSNLYWGFKHALNFYYKGIEALHTGDLNDYVKWLTVSMALALLLVGGGLL